LCEALEKYAGVIVEYGYNTNKQLETVSKNNVVVTSYEYSIIL